MIAAAASTAPAEAPRASEDRGETEGSKKIAKKAEAPAAEAPKENLSLDPNDVEKPKIIKAKGSKNVYSGFAHVLSTFNNTIVTITDLNGNVIGWSSAAKSVSKARARARPTRRKWSRRTRRARRWVTA